MWSGSMISELWHQTQPSRKLINTACCLHASCATLCHLPSSARSPPASRPLSTPFPSLSSGVSSFPPSASQPLSWVYGLLCPCAPRAGGMCRVRRDIQPSLLWVDRLLWTCGLIGPQPVGAEVGWSPSACLHGGCCSAVRNGTGLRLSAIVHHGI